MPVIEDDHVVQAFAPDTPDHSLHITVLPRTLRCNPNLLDTYSFNSCSEVVTVNCISISNQIPWSDVSWKCFNDLLCGPNRCRMFSDVEVPDTTTVVRQDDEDVQHV